MTPLVAAVFLLSGISWTVAAEDTAGVIATFPNGRTNPPEPFLAAVGSLVNQTSDSRLVTLNSVDDFCLFGPPEPGPDSTISNIEATAVAYCTQARNGARLIPDGIIHSAHFIRTPMYVQIQGEYLLLPYQRNSAYNLNMRKGYFDGTRIGIPTNDDGESSRCFVFPVTGLTFLYRQVENSILMALRTSAIPSVATLRPT